MWGFQFWANLPASHKMIAPRYQEVKAADIPEVTLENGVKIKVVAGEIDGVKGPAQNIIIEPQMLDITVPRETVFAHALPSDHTAFVYVLDGEGYFDDCRDAYAYEVVGHGWTDLERRCICGHETVVLFEHAGDSVQVTTTEKPVRFLFVSGKPLKEPVAWYGPIVMNTQEELKVAFEEYNNGTFIK
jgi:hypothetical protein